MEAFSARPDLLKEAVPPARRAVAAFDEQLISKGDFFHLSDYYYRHKEGIDRLQVAEHYWYLGKALEMLGMKRAAARSFFRAWRLGPSEDALCPLLLDWARTTLGLARAEEVQSIVSLMDSRCPEAAMAPEAMLIKAEAAMLQHDWQAACNMAVSSLEVEETSKAALTAIKALVKLGQWQQAQSLFRRHRGLFEKEEQMEILRSWGDEALKLQEAAEASRVYRRLIEMEQEMDQQPPSSDLFRLALAERLLKGPKAVAELFRQLSKEGDSPWKNAAKEEIRLEQFLQSIEGVI